jgi:NAD-dependent dihydropyrimidine dehydrogenase PreA subunit
MQSVFISKLKPFLDAVAESVTGGELYVPKKTGEHYVYSKYDPSAETAVEYNNIRTCTPVKEFLFPLCELAAVFPEPTEPEEVKPFAVFGLKDCDLRSIEILDKVFLEADFRDSLYAARRGNMFIISTDCFDPGESCFCNICNGQPFAQGGFDLNVSQVKDGFVIEPGSQNGKDFIEKHSDIFSDVPQGLLAERDENRTRTQNKLQQQNAEFQFDATTREVMVSRQDSDVFDAEAQDCVECQGCTRVCPTCHCFYLYDTKQKDYFAKMKMWDSCMRRAYAEVAGGANPRRILGDRLKHRLLHKFVYFLDRYGIDMCVGCGRCIDACPGGIDIRAILKKLNDQLLDKPKAKVAK